MYVLIKRLVYRSLISNFSFGFVFDVRSERMLSHEPELLTSVPGPLRYLRICHLQVLGYSQLGRVVPVGVLLEVADQSVELCRILLDPSALL